MNLDIRILNRTFFQKVEIKGENECWPWKASKTGKGYGKFYFGNRLRGAHEVSFIIHNGLYSPGLVIRHSCHRKDCVNPRHLILGTYSDNLQDEKDKGRTLGVPKIISDEIIIKIFHLRLKKVSYKEIESITGINSSYCKSLIASNSMRKELREKFEEEFGKIEVARRRLDRQDAKEIRRLYKEKNMLQKDIAKMYNISHNYVSSIISYTRFP